MAGLHVEPRLEDPDGLYAELIAAQEGMADGESLRFCARLVLLLANHIGEEEVVREAIRLARETAPSPAGAAVPEARRDGG